jgi:hypothetical protein
MIARLIQMREPLGKPTNCCRVGKPEPAAKQAGQSCCIGCGTKPNMEGTKPDMEGGTKPNMEGAPGPGGTKPNMEGGTRPDMEGGTKPNMEVGTRPNTKVKRPRNMMTRSQIAENQWRQSGSELYLVGACDLLE